MANETGGLPAVSNPFAPDVFADDAIAFELINDTVRISFGAIKMAEPCPPCGNQIVVVGRLVMPVFGAQRLAIGLNAALIEKGLDPSALARGEETAQ